MKYSPDRGAIDLTAGRDDHAPVAATSTVRDQGIGVPAAHLPNIFERYHRAMWTLISQIT